MTTLGTMFAGVYLAMPAKTKEKDSGPPINAASKDEEKFIQYASMPEREHLVSSAGDLPILITVLINIHRDFLKNAGGGEKAKT